MRSPPKLCSAPGCQQVTDGNRCAAHPYLPRQRTRGDKDYDRERGTAKERGYGHRWSKVRRAHIVGEPLCRSCSAAGRVTAASEVDHIVPLRSGGTHDPSNLQSLCHPCHVSKTALDARTAASTP